jgi:hypothetical protein
MSDFDPLSLAGVLKKSAKLKGALAGAVFFSGRLPRRKKTWCRPSIILWNFTPEGDIKIKNKYDAG